MERAIALPRRHIACRSSVSVMTDATRNLTNERSDDLAERFEERFTIANRKITEIEVIGNPARLGDLDVAMID